MTTPDRARFEAWQRQVAATAARLRIRADELAHTPGPHAARWVPRLQQQAAELEQLAEQLTGIIAANPNSGSPTP